MDDSYPYPLDFGDEVRIALSHGCMHLCWVIGGGNDLRRGDSYALQVGQDHPGVSPQQGDVVGAGQVFSRPKWRATT